MTPIARRAAWATGFAVVAFSSHAEARLPTRLVYVRAPATSQCPDQSVLEAAVAARLGYEPFSPWGDQTIIATVSRVGNRLRARAELVDRDGIVQGNREVSAEMGHCEELLATLALAISITLDPMQLKAVPEPVTSDASEPTATEAASGDEQANTRSDDEATESNQAASDAERGANAPPRAEADSLRVATQPPPASGETRMLAHAGATGFLLATPRPALGARLGVGLRHERLSLWVDGAMTLPATEPAETGEIRIQLIAGSVAPCLHLLQPLAACALGTLGVLRGEGRGVSAPRSESVPFASAGARAQLDWPLGGAFSLLGTADVSAIFTRPTFKLRQSEVWRPGVVAVAAGFGVAARFF